MSQIDELQRRIAAALDRISQSLEAAGRAGGADAAELAAVQAQLEDEKIVTAQLEERLKRLKERQDEAEAQAAAASEETRAALKSLDGELQSLRRANAQLRENNKLLREAHEAGVSEPHLINKAMLAELEALRAARGADRAEADMVMTELSRVLSADTGEREGA